MRAWHGSRRPEHYALAVLLATALAAAMSAWWQYSANRSREARLFAATVEQRVEQIQTRLQRYEYGLRGARGAVIGAGGAAISRERFRDYIDSRDPVREFPGARGFGFIRRVAPAELDAFLHMARAEQRPAFDIRQLEPHDGERWVIQYIEPESDNHQAVGLDIASNPVRRQAAQLAMDSGEPRLTAPITLVQATDHPQQGFLLMLPVYDAHRPIATVDERRAATLGWAYAPLIIDEVLGDLDTHVAGVALQLFDIGSDRKPYLFYADADASRAGVRGLHVTHDLQVFGRHWRIAARGLPQLVAGSGALSPLTAGFAVAGIGGLLAAITLILMRGRLRRAQQQAMQDALARGIVDAVPQAIVVVGEDGRIVQLNARTTEVFGHPRETLIGAPIESLIPGGRRAEHEQLRQGYDRVARAMAARRELTALHADGHEFPVEINLSPLTLGGQPVVVAGVLDVTERRAALRRIEESEARWRQMANSQPQLIWTCTATGGCDFLSQRWLDYTGIGEPEQLGYGWLQQVHPDDREALQQRWQQAVESLSTFHIEFRIRRHDGVYRWFDTQAVPLLDEEGHLLRWIGSNTDIHQRREFEESLRELNATLESRVSERTALLERARADLRSILDAMPSMIGYWDRDLRNRFANHAYRDWFGVDPESRPGVTLPELLGPTLYEQNRPYIEGALAGQPQQFERQIGDRYSIARYIPDKVGDEVRGFYAFVTDVTELKRATAAAEAASAAKSSFLANMSHEIRTPMNAVMNFCYLLEQGELAADQRDLVSKMGIASRSLLGLINDVLDLSKIEAGQMGLSAEVFSLRGLLHEAVQLLSAQASGKKIELHLEIDNRVPAYVRGDSLRLNQVLSNLIGNAVKFTERGGVRVEVVMVSKEQGLVRLRFSVKDTGIGIAPDAQQHLFEPFTQADASTTRRFGGSGLGLAIVKRLVDLMGGEIGVESQLGAGSHFWFSISLKEETEAMLAGGAPNVFEALIADDSEAERDSLAACARTLGWRAETVSSGNEAFEHIEDRMRSGRPFDALVIDWRMPGMDGLQTLAELHRRYGQAAAPAVILVTACDRDELTGIPDVQLADAVLSKPVDASTLFNAVHEATARRAGSSPLKRSADRDRGRRRLEGLRVLLVDDSAINLEVGQRVLERVGAEVVVASDGERAIDVLRNASAAFDLVLMDVQMPVLDGHQATRRIRTELGLARLPIIALTAGALVSERQRALECGMNDFISKPFDPEQMISAICRAVGRVQGAPPADEAAPGDAPVIEGLRIKDVGARLGGDWALLRSLLRRLLEEFANDWPDGVVLDPAQYAALAQRAHKLRGVAGNVGADTLRQSAARLETCASEGVASELPLCIAAVVAELSRLRRASAAFLQAEPVPSDSTQAVDLDPLALSALLDRLRQQSLDALDRYAALRPALRSRLDAVAYRELDACMQRLDFSGALQHLGAFAAA